MSYDFPLVGTAGQAMTVPAGAESLLISSRPTLTDDQRRQVLALTAIDSGRPLDEGTAGSWQRLDLSAAMSVPITVAADGTVSLAAAPVDPAPVDPAPVDPAPADPGATVPVVPAQPVAGGAMQQHTPGTITAADAATRDAAARDAAARADLAYTGSDRVVGIVAAALGLLAAGVGLVVLHRRRAARRP